MKKQITRFSIIQSSKIVVVLYVLFGLIYTIVGIPMIMFGEGQMRSVGIFYLFMPVIMGVFGFLAVAFSMWVYNMLAARLGGIEFTLEDVGE